MKVGRTDGRDGSHDFTELQLIEDSRFTGGVQAHHQNSHVLLAPEAIEELRKRETHLGGVRGVSERERVGGLCEEECSRGWVSCL